MSIWKAAQEALNPIFRPAQTQIDGITPGDWNSPQQPIRPVQPPNIGVRTWDFNPGINLRFTPRGDQPISFRQLHTVSNSFDLCRLMIETRKDQVVNRPWLIRVKPQPGEKKKDRLAREAKTPNIQKVTELLKRPDGVRPFPLWIRMWLEQLLVFDAPTIFPVRNVLGDVMSLRIISGATITPLVDQYGFIPLPPEPAYQQIILGIPTSNLTTTAQQEKAKKYTADQLIYTPRNPRCDSRWGFSPVEQIITTLAIASNRQQFLKNYYTEGNVPEGFMPAPKDWSMSQIKDLQNWLDSMLAGNLKKRRRMIVAPDTQKGVQFSKDKALTDLTDEYLIRVVAFAFSVTPQNLIKQVNRGTAKESTDVAQIEGLEPTLKHVETTMNCEVLEKTLGITDVEFAYADEREMDPLKQAQVDQIYITTGTYTRNEVREAKGDDPLPQPEANEPLITTATGAVPLDQPAQPAGGGDPNNEGKADRQPAGKIKKNSTRLGTELTAQSTIKATQFEHTCTAFLAELGRKAAKQASWAYTKAAKLRKDDAEDEQKRKFEEVIAAIELEWEALGRDITPLLEAAGAAGVELGRQQVSSLDVPTEPYLDAARSHAWNYANARAAELVGMKRQEDGSFVPNPDARWAISETTREDLRETIREAFENKWKPSQLAAVIENSYTFSADRSALIAKTEIANSQAQGNLASWMKAGVIQAVQWQTSADHDCCDVCDEFEDQGEVEPGHEFAPGIMAPGAHPNCNCALVVKKVKEAVVA